MVAENAPAVIDSLLEMSNDMFNSKVAGKHVIDKNLRKASELADENNLPHYRFNIYILMSKRYSWNAKYLTAIEYANKAYTIADSLNDDLKRAAALQELGNNFRKVNDNSRALKFHTLELELSENKNDTFLIHCSYNGIGNVYFEYKDYPKAIDYFHKSLQYLKTDPPNILGDAINSNLLGESWLYLGNTDSAMYYMIRSFEANVKLGSNLGKGICYNGFGLIYQKKKEDDKALTAFNKALKLFKAPEDIYYIAMAHYNIGNTYLRTDDLKKAKSHLNLAGEYSEKIGNKSFAVKALKQLMEVYDDLNLSDKALKTAMQVIAYEDSITKEMQRQDIEAMKLIYNAEKQKSEILILQQKQKLAELKLERQKFLTIIIAGIAIILLLAGIFIYRQNQLRNKLKETGLKQQLLRSQMNPHFIFNSLGTIQNFMYNNETKKAAFYLGSFSSLMRAILNNSREELITVEEEIKTLKDYLELQKMRLGFSFKVNCSNDIDTEFTLIPPMLIQPFVENAIKHGIKDMGEDGRIEVTFSKKYDRLIVSVEDNGVGVNYESTSEKDHKSLALKIFKERISYLSVYFKKDVNYKISDKSETNSGKKGTTVIVDLPLIVD
jgi:tetratricopeptide (TPR) repeat protein